MDGKNSKEIVVPEIIDVKIGSKLEAKWKDTRDKAKESIMVDTMNLEISEAICKIAEKHIVEEKDKFK